MDISDSIIPDSDQLNADDLIAGPITVTIADVTTGSREQPFNFVTEEFGKRRPYRPSKSMRRVIVQCWGKESSVYQGRRLTLYREPTIRFGDQEVGGIRISHLSHIDEPQRMPLTTGRGRRSPYQVLPLVDTGPITDGQSRRLGALFREKNLADRDQAMAFCSKVLGEDVHASKNLTSAQASKVIAALTAVETNDEPQPEVPDA